MSPVSRLHWSRLSGGSSRPIAGSSSSPNSRAALQSRRTRPAPLLRELSKNSEVEPMDPVRLGSHLRSPCNLESSRAPGDLVAAAMDLPSSSLGLQIRLRHYRMLGSLHSWRGRQSAHWPIGGSWPGGAGVRWPRHFLRCEQRRSPFTMVWINRPLRLVSSVSSAQSRKIHVSSVSRPSTRVRSVLKKGCGYGLSPHPLYLPLVKMTYFHVSCVLCTLRTGRDNLFWLS